jgi:hypothetical protein
MVPKNNRTERFEQEEPTVFARSSSLLSSILIRPSKCTWGYPTSSFLGKTSGGRLLLWSFIEQLDHILDHFLAFTLNGRV